MSVSVWNGETRGPDKKRIVPLPPIELTGQERIVVAEPGAVALEAVHGLREAEPKTADHGIARMDGDYQIFTPLTELPGYDPDADLVLVSRAGRLRWVPTETCQ